MAHATPLILSKDLKNELKSVATAHYKRGEDRLPNTRTAMLASVDTWVRDSAADKTAWIHGYAGSGKSAPCESGIRHSQSFLCSEAILNLSHPLLSRLTVNTLSLLRMT